jgi:hypothetical protein
VLELGGPFVVLSGSLFGAHSVDALNVHCRSRNQHTEDGKEGAVNFVWNRPSDWAQDQSKPAIGARDHSDATAVEEW